MARFVESQHSAGSCYLLALLERSTQEAVAKVLRVRQASVSRWASGKRRPRGERRKMIEAMLGIPRASWDEPPATRQIHETRSSAGSLAVAA